MLYCSLVLILLLNLFYSDSTANAYSKAHINSGTRSRLLLAGNSYSKKLVTAEAMCALSSNMDTLDYVEHEDALNLYNALKMCNDSFISKEINHALDTLSDAIRLYGPDYVFSSYNGGKDAVVVMHLMRASMAKYSQDCGIVHKPRFIYFSAKEEFPDIIDTIEESVKKYRMNMLRYNEGINLGLTNHIEMNCKGRPSAFVLGTREGDPNSGGQQTFSPSSSWMPPFMRVNPILYWNYGHVWHFLRNYNLPYCNLYDEGYTSLGKISDTRPNPALRRSDSTEEVYFPAYMLEDWSLERAGRGILDTNEKSDENIKRNTTACVLIVGDEILNGFTEENNFKCAVTALSTVGICIKRVSIVPDDVKEIADEVTRLAKKYDLVFTSGGVGPTTDDVTIQAIADAFKQPLEINVKMLAHLKTLNSNPDNFERLATLPQKAKLHFPPSGEGNSAPWPILQVENVFILPGIPKFFKQKMDYIVEHCVEKCELQSVRRVILNQEESMLVKTLNNLVSRHLDVKIGSYPYIDHSEYKTIIRIESSHADAADKCVSDLLSLLSPEEVVRVEK